MSHASRTTEKLKTNRNMPIDFKEMMSKMSDYELNGYIENRKNYTKEAVESAILELKYRGKEFSEIETTEILQQFNKKKVETKEPENINLFASSNGWKKNVVTDQSATEFYSEKAIYLFSVIFSVLFGSVLMAINLRKTESKKGVFEVLGFGILFFAFQIYVLSMIPRNTIFTLMFSMVGAVILNYFFWRKYIGQETKYRAKPIWIPLIIGIVLLAGYIFLMVTLANMGIPIE